MCFIVTFCIPEGKNYEIEMDLHFFHIIRNFRAFPVRHRLDKSAENSNYLRNRTDPCCSKIFAPNKPNITIKNQKSMAIMVLQRYLAGATKGPFICTSNLKIHLAITASNTETAAPALP